VRTPARVALLGAVLAGLLGVGAGQAAASYTGQVQNGVLKITGNSASDTLALRILFSTGTLDLDVGDDATADLSFDRSTFTSIEVDAGGGDDVVRVSSEVPQFADEPITLGGGAGNDTLIGASGAETLLGGSGNDTADGNLGQDLARLGIGNDVFDWDPGDNTDVVDGEAGSDRLDFHGSAASESLEIAANGPRVRLTRNIAAINMDLGGIETIALDPRAGADSVVVGDTTGTELQRADVDISPADGAADSVIARGSDADDGVAIANDVDVSGLGALVHVKGDEAALDSVAVQTLGGADTIASGLSLASALDVNADGGDGPDTLHYQGNAADNGIVVAPNGGEIRMADAIAITGLDALAVEDLRLEGLGGADTISAVSQAPLPAQVTFDGGIGNDTLRGSGAGDAMLGGTGNDTVDGNRGNDAVLLGSGNDVAAWHPGDGNDSVEGEAGSDRVEFTTSNIGELIDVSSNGERVRLTRNVGTVAMDFDDVEELALRVLAGEDTITVNPLTGTALGTVDVDLAAAGGAGDAQKDTVITNGTDEADAVRVRRSGTQTVVGGLGAETEIGGGEPALDTLRIQTLGGNDSVVVGDIWDLITPLVDLGANE
jgi:Ca2+-binding RTX toxin-like protein